MLDGEKFLRELPVLHGKIEMPDYNGGIIRMCERVAASGGTLTPYSA